MGKVLNRCPSSLDSGRPSERERCLVSRMGRKVGPIGSCYVFK